ncbi:MAG TPA: hypothetical protein DEF51_33880 [Myxococcales bacterium]|nr:hypothetical protein [Myxococcales bacterium]
MGVEWFQGMRHSQSGRAIAAFTGLAAIVLPAAALAQPMDRGMCQGCMGGGWMMIAGGVLLLAIIASLVALTVSVVRRSNRTPRH